MGKTSRLDILSAVSDWLKLLALTVIVAESVILIAMQITPQSNPIAPWYPLFMLIFLVVIVIGVFVDRYLLRETPKELVVGSGEGEVHIDTGILKVPSEELAKVSKVDLGSKFIDSQKGFMFNRPKLPLWSDPQYVSYREMMVKMGVLEEGVLEDSGKWEQVKQMLCMNPIFRMLVECPILLLSYGDPIDVEFTDETSTILIDDIIKSLVSQAEKDGAPMDEDDIKDLRRTLVWGGGSWIKQMSLQNRFAVMVLDKSLADKSPIEPNLGNVFLAYTRTSQLNVESLVANESSILWGYTANLTNVMIDGRLQELRTFQREFLTESDRSIFLVSIWFSPQTSSSLDIWPELKDMITSFRVIS